MTNIQSDEKLEGVMWGYRPAPVRRFFTWLGIVCSGFLLGIFFHWVPRFFLRATHRQCSLRDAEKVLVRDEHGQYFVCNVHVCTLDGTEVRLLQRGSRKLDRKQPAYQMHSTLQTEDENLLRYFTHKKLKYVWMPEDESFVPVKSFNVNLTKDVHEMQHLSFQDANRRRVFYGANIIDVPVTPLLKVFVLQVLNPFYIFQIFSCIVWYTDEYWQYATCIVIESALSLSLAVFETRRNERALRNTIESSGQTLVYRQGESRELPSDLLVPGDIIEIPRHGCPMHCDAVLLSGNCIVNESMLTGESVPVSKVPKPVPEDDSAPATIDMKEHGRHILFSGTRVIQARNYEGQKVRALVLRTGFLTSKGELVRAIMFPKPMRYKFDQDILHYLAVLSCFAAVGFFYTIAIMISYNKAGSLIAKRALDLITVVVPPALPAAMSVGLVYSLRRLKARRVFCIAPNTINACGGIDVVAFDKTGTLTEEGLDLRKVLYKSEQADCLVEEINPQMLDSSSALVSCMAAAHSLAYINGEVCGDPIDLKMFEAIRWKLGEPHVGPSDREGDTVQQMVPRVVTFQPAGSMVQSGAEREIGLLREFPFSSTLQRMAVLGRILGSSHFSLFVKGSPEMVRELSLPETVPADLDAKLAAYTQRGYRVLALACRSLPKLSLVRVHRVSREEVERDLTFVGLLVMENRLKKESKPTIRVLKNANIRTLMVTGDNILTALSVAHDCSILEPDDRVVRVHTSFHAVSGDLEVLFQEVEEAGKRLRTSSESSACDSLLQGPARIHIALTGREWHEISKSRPQLLPKLAVLGTVFARFSPEQKAQLILALQDVDYTVAMCGDGANDCGALKAAHAGVSLSEAEASVASPFTSKRQNISCVPDLIREGRCALVTSFGIFKYMAAYSLTQFITVLLFYYLKMNLTDAEFLYIDLITITSLSITFGYTRPAKSLHPMPPPNRLITIPVLLSILGVQITNAAFLFGSLHFVQRQSWFHPRDEYEAVENENYSSYENTVLFIVSSFQYIAFAFIYAKGYPYRRNFYTNIFFVLNLIILVCFTIYIAINPHPVLKDWLEMVDLPTGANQSYVFRVILVGLAAINFFVCFFIEASMDSIVFRRFLSRLREAGLLPNRKTAFNALSARLRECNWPECELDRWPKEENASDVGCEKLSKKQANVTAF